MLWNYVNTQQPVKFLSIYLFILLWIHPIPNLVNGL